MRDRMEQCGLQVARRVIHACAQLTAVVVVSVAATSRMSAQRIPDINGPKKAAQAAADAENNRLSAQTGQAVPTRVGAPAKAPVSGPGSAPAGRGAATTASITAVSTAAPGTMVVTREIFDYADEGRRDPFFSLILTEDLRPLLSDLRLVGILYETSGRKSVAIMRDVLTNAQYRVNAGMTLGRMRVAQIKPRAVIFTIEEFGLSRQDSLFMVDSTKTRIR